MRVEKDKRKFRARDCGYEIMEYSLRGRAISTTSTNKTSVNIKSSSQFFMCFVHRSENDVLIHNLFAFLASDKQSELLHTVVKFVFIFVAAIVGRHHHHGVVYFTREYDVRCI